MMKMMKMMMMGGFQIGLGLCFLGRAVQRPLAA